MKRIVLLVVDELLMGTSVELGTCVEECHKEVPVVGLEKKSFELISKNTSGADEFELAYVRLPARRGWADGGYAGGRAALGGKMNGRDRGCLESCAAGLPFEIGALGGFSW